MPMVERTRRKRTCDARTGRSGSEPRADIWGSAPQQVLLSTMRDRSEALPRNGPAATVVEARRPMLEERLMRFGINFFPAFRPNQKTTAEYYAQCLRVSERADELGFNSIKTVEHYFHDYGGHSPNPIVLLAAIAARTKRVRPITGAVIPAFNHPIKLAGELAMLDNISNDGSQPSAWGGCGWRTGQNAPLSHGIRKSRSGPALG